MAYALIMEIDRTFPKTPNSKDEILNHPQGGKAYHSAE
jgi:hypothetical protein